MGCRFVNSVEEWSSSRCIDPEEWALNWLETETETGLCWLLLPSFWNSFVGYLLVILSMVREIFTWNSINSPEWDGLCQASRITMNPRRSAAGQWTVSQFLSRLWFQVSIWQMMFFNCDGWGNLKLFVFFFGFGHIFLYINNDSNKSNVFHAIIFVLYDAVYL